MEAMFHAQVMSQLEETEDWLRWCDECNEQIETELRNEHGKQLRNTGVPECERQGGEEAEVFLSVLGLGRGQTDALRPFRELEVRAATDLAGRNNDGVLHGDSLWGAAHHAIAGNQPQQQANPQPQLV